jgi:hypothetical protein
MEGRETGSAGQKKRLPYWSIQENGIPYPTIAADYYKKIPAAFLNAKYNENPPDSENIWAFIEGSENQMKYW